MSPGGSSRASSRAPGLTALGASLARSAPMPVTAIAVGVVTTFAMIVAAFVLGARGSRALAELPALTASLLAWGAGVLLAFAAAAHALRRDREQGVRALVASRGGSTRAYLWARAFGLVVAIAIVVAGGTLLVGIASTALAPTASVARVAGGAGASLAYALAFSITIAPVALASLGARSRAGGYLWLVGVLLLPELLSGWTTHLMPRGWSRLTSIPAALAELRHALAPPGVDYAEVLRASVLLLAVAAVCLAIVRQQIARVDAEGWR